MTIPEFLLEVGRDPLREVDDGIYEMNSECVWVVVGPVALWIRRDGECAVVEAFPNTEERIAITQLTVAYEEARELGGVAYEDEKEDDDAFTIFDWQYEVANGDTVLGYIEWVQHKKEAQA